MNKIRLPKLNLNILNKQINITLYNPPNDFDFNKIRLLVFDFDGTITKKHASGSSHEQITQKNIIDNIRNINFLRKLVKRLTKKNKYSEIPIVIATFSDDNDPNALFRQRWYGTKLVKKYCDVVFGKNRSFLTDFECFSPNDNKVGKNLHLINFAKKYSLKPNQILLIDDDKRNCAIAQKHGYKSFWANPTDDDCLPNFFKTLFD